MSPITLFVSSSLSTLPREVLLFLRDSHIPDLSTHIALSQTCYKFRFIYGDAFFEPACRKLGLGRSGTRPDGRNGDMPTWTALASAVVKHSAACKLERCTTILRKDIRDLSVPKVITPKVAKDEKLLVSFDRAVSSKSEDYVEMGTPFDHRAAYFFLDGPNDREEGALKHHVTAASLMGTYPPISSFKIDMWGVNRTSKLINTQGLTCHDLIKGLCDILRNPLDPAESARHHEERINVGLKGPDDGVLRVYNLIGENFFFAGFKEMKHGSLVTECKFEDFTFEWPQNNDRLVSRITIHRHDRV